MSDTLDDRVDELEALVDALRRRSESLQHDVWELEEENDQLRDRVADLEEIVNPDPTSREYDHLSKPQKVHRIRRSLVEKAAQTRGAARMQYDDVQWLFDGHPSPGHAYDLMELAAQLDGFEYDTPGDGGKKRVRVNLDAVKDETLIHAANKASTGGRA